MPIKVTCNSCGGVLHAPDDAAGKRGRCPTCGMILSIPADAPRVASEVAPMPAAPPAGFAIPPTAESLAFPRPPAFGTGDDGMKSSFGSRNPAAMASRLPPDPRHRNDPFSKPGKTPQAASADAISRKWARVDRGLGWIRGGAVLITLGVIVPSALVIAEMNGVKPPDRSPGLLGLAGVTMLSEIKVGSAAILFLIGGLAFIRGRGLIAAVPAETGAKSVASAAALFTVLSFLCYSLALGLGVRAALNGTPPNFAPQPELLAPGLQLQQQVEGYLRQVLIDGASRSGKVQRVAAAGFLAAAIISDLWLLGALSRLAAYLRSPRALARTNRFAILAGLLIAGLPVAWVSYHYFGRGSLGSNWENLASPLRESIRAGGFAASFAVMAFLYTRSLRGLRTAIRESIPS